MAIYIAHWRHQYMNGFSHGVKHWYFLIYGVVLCFKELPMLFCYVFYYLRSWIQERDKSTGHTYRLSGIDLLKRDLPS